jgi:hypothetical protein
MAFLIIFRESVLPLFLIAAIAALYQRAARPDIRQIADAALMVFAPVFVFNTLVAEDISWPALYGPFGLMVLLTGCLMLLAWGASRLLRLEAEDGLALILACSMINVGNFGLPLIHFAYGQQALNASVLVFVVFNLPLCTVAICLTSQKTAWAEMARDVARIPIFHAMIAAMALTTVGISLPESLSKGLDLLGGAAIPLLIFVLGLQLAKIGVSSRIRAFVPVLAAAVFIRLIISPVLALGIVHLLGFSGLERDVAVVQTSGPSALLPLMYAISFGRRTELLASIILVTSLCSALTMPLVIAGVNWL